MQSVPAFLAVAAAVTLIPGPAFALLLQVAAVHGRRAALANIAGNSVGVLTWGLLSAAGVSALVAANRVAYEVLHLAGAAFLLWLGLRALLSRRTDPHLVAAPDRSSSPRPALTAARKGLVNSLANPKLAVFFVSLFPQFIEPATAVLPAALAMAAVIVLFDVLWYGTVAMLVDRVRDALAERLLRRLERLTGAVLVFFGIRLATEAR
jgi:threonine/homoserine/homoserine lactone efflux protein